MRLPRERCPARDLLSRLAASLAAGLLIGLMAGTAIGSRSGSSDEEILTRIRNLHKRLKLSPRDSYLNYAIATLARRASIDLRKEEIPFPLAPVVTDDPARRADLFALAGGLTALHESLQLTEMLGPVRTGSGRHVPLDRLAPPPLPSPDYESLEAARRQAGGAAWEADTGFLEDARLVPADWIFVRFADGAALLATLREIELWMRHVEVFYGLGRGQTDYLWRLFDDLGLPDPHRVPGFYDALPGPLVITMSDPFVREGTDVTVILPKGTPVGLAGLLKPPAGAATERHTAQVGGRVLLSSSAAAIERIRALDPADSLAESADLHQAASRLAPRADDAVAAFLSERFLERLSGPRLRVLESRRVRCASHLRTIVNALVLYREEHPGERDPAGTLAPPILEDLVAQDYLTAGTLICPHGGAYRLEEISPAGAGATGTVSPVCSIHGRLGHLRPLDAMQLTEVTEEEAATYQRFSRSYARFWQRAFDPTLITARRAGRSWQLDLLLMPLAENSLYRNLIRLCGGEPAEEEQILSTPQTVFSTSLMAEEGLLENLVELLVRQGLLAPEDRAARRAGLADERLTALREGFTREVTLGLLDAPLLFDFDLPMFLAEALRWNMSQDIALTPLLAGASLPAYVVCPVKDAAAARRFLDALHQGAVTRGGESRSSRFALRYQGFDLAGDGPGGSAEVAAGESPSRIRAITVEIFAFELRLFYTLRDAGLFIASRPDVLEQVVHSAHPGPVSAPFNLNVSLLPAHWQAIGPTLELDYEEAARRRCLADLIALGPFHRLGRDAWTETLRLVAPCPDRGRREAPAGEPLRCTVHGRPEAPAQPAGPAPENAISRLLAATRQISFALRFIPEGLRATVRIER